MLWFSSPHQSVHSRTPSSPQVHLQGLEARHLSGKGGGEDEEMDTGSGDGSSSDDGSGDGSDDSDDSDDDSR